MVIEYNHRGKELTRDIILFIRANGNTTFEEVCQHFPDVDRKTLLNEMRKLNDWQIRTCGYKKDKSGKVWRAI